MILTRLVCLQFVWRCKNILTDRMLYVFNLVLLKVSKDGHSVVFKWYCPFQTAVDKGFFYLASGTVDFTPWFEKPITWSQVRWLRDDPKIRYVEHAMNEFQLAVITNIPKLTPEIKTRPILSTVYKLCYLQEKYYLLMWAHVQKLNIADVGSSCGHKTCDRVVISFKLRGEINGPPDR